MKEYKPFKSGKVRELYDLGDSLVMVCTDRISAFDVILKDPVPEKGAVLNKMSKFWFDFTKDIVPNQTSCRTICFPLTRKTCRNFSGLRNLKAAA